MKRINSFEELSNLISNNFKKGVLTNCFVAKDDFEYYINNKKLFYISYGGGLLIFIKRQGFYNMKYYINDLNCDIKLPRYSKVVTEVVGKTEKSLETILEVFRKNNLNVVLNRLRLSCGNPEIDEKLELKNVEKIKDYKKIIKILRKNYDKYTGCIPTNSEMVNDDFYCYKDGKKILGILHVCSKSNKTEMRHLVVPKKYRGRNISKCLITKYLLDTNEKSKQVWTSVNNEVAKNLFAGFGYEADGFVSAVLMN